MPSPPKRHNRDDRGPGSGGFSGGTPHPLSSGNYSDSRSSQTTKSADNRGSSSYQRDDSTRNKSATQDLSKEPFSQKLAQSFNESRGKTRSWSEVNPEKAAELSNSPEQKDSVKQKPEIRLKKLKVEESSEKPSATPEITPPEVSHIRKGF